MLLFRVQAVLVIRLRLLELSYNLLANSLSLPSKYDFTHCFKSESNPKVILHLGLQCLATGHQLM